MKYKVINSAIKINHRIYNIGDEITLASIPESLTHLLEPIKDLPARRSAGRVILSGLVRRGVAEASKKTTKRKNKMEK